MPVVRREREIRTNALPGARLTSSKTALSTGVGIEHAKAQTGETLANIGAQASRIGVGLFTKIQQQETDKADQVAALAFDNKFAAWETSRLYGQNGALSRQGKDALGLPEEVGEEFEKLAGEIEKTAGNERQRMLFQKIKSQRQQGLDVTIQRHTFQEMQAYGRDELNSTLVNAHNEAVAKALSPHEADAALARGIDAIKVMGPKLGMGEETVKKQIDTLRSQTLDGVVTRLLANGYDQKAKVYFEDAKEKGLIADGDVLARLEEKVKQGTTDANGERAAAKIWDTLGPKSDSEPISLDVMEKAARAEFPNDVASAKAAISALRSRKQGVDDGRRERNNAQDSAIWGAVFEGRNMAEIRRMPEFVNADGQTRTRISDYFDNEAARVESRLAARESRAGAAEARLQNAAARHERELELKGWSTYLDMSDPAKLKTMTRGDILKQLPELGQAHVNRLLNDQEKLAKDEATFRAAVIDRDLFNSIMDEAGVPGVYQSPSQRGKTQSANLGKLQATIEDEIARKQVAAGRRLTREETEVVAKSVVDRKVMVRDWFVDDPAIAAIVNPKDIPNAYVPIDQIPEGLLGRTLNLVRSSNPAFQGLTDDQLKVRAKAQLESSYAAYVLNLGEAEVLKRLQGVK